MDAAWPSVRLGHGVPSLSTLRGRSRTEAGSARPSDQSSIERHVVIARGRSLVRTRPSMSAGERSVRRRGRSHRQADAEDGRGRCGTPARTPCTTTVRTAISSLSRLRARGRAAHAPRSRANASGRNVRAWSVAGHPGGRGVWGQPGDLVPGVAAVGAGPADRPTRGRTGDSAADAGRLAPRRPRAAPVDAGPLGLARSARPMP
jgi:hypothetical protein